MVKPTPQQQQVLSIILDWLGGKKYPYLTIGGYAGTGKTTLIGLLRDKLSKIKEIKKIAYCAYTGKATMVMRETLKAHTAIKDGDWVSTIHSLIYSAITDENTGEILGWERKKNITADLIIVDEASMIDASIWKDLLSYDLPILAIGDHGQLPPISGSFSLMEKPHIRLETILRQAAENPIIKLSMIARTEGKIPIGTFSSDVKKLDKQDPYTQETILDLFNSFDTNMMILVGYNRTRVAINKELRNIREKYEESPQPGDRVICLKNNHRTGLYNGMLGTVIEITPNQKNKSTYQASIKLDFQDQLYSGEIWKNSFNNPQFGQDREHTKGDIFDFGYALTVHKSQGSQAEKVVLFEERFPQMDDDMWQRWLYTGITRAINSLYIIGE